MWGWAANTASLRDAGFVACVVVLGHGFSYVLVGGSLRILID